MVELMADIDHVINTEAIWERGRAAALQHPDHDPGLTDAELAGLATEYCCDCERCLRDVDGLLSAAWDAWDAGVACAQRDRAQGIEAALTHATSLVMEPSQAKAIVLEYDPDTLDAFPPLGHDTMTHTVWYLGVCDVWADAVRAHALRILGDIADARRIERDLERKLEVLA